MSFGLNISFGRLCRKERKLENIYSEARKIEGWKDYEDGNCIWGMNRKRIIYYYINRPTQFIVPTSV